MGTVWEPAEDRGEFRESPRPESPRYCLDNFWSVLGLGERYGPTLDVQLGAGTGFGIGHFRGTFAMLAGRRVSIFRNGRNQAIRILREFELEGSEALIHRERNRLIIEPLPAKNRLLALLATLTPLPDEFPSINDPPAGDKDIF